jgi:predicted anti-sigma-YlaC factor YlaD
MSCDDLFDHAPGFLDGSLVGIDRESAVRHLEECSDCRALIAALTAPHDPGLAEEILARTSGAACERARWRLCDRVDGELEQFDAELVDGHLLHCSECGALALALRRLQVELPRLAAIDPGPGFVEAVIARTSRRPRRVPFRARWAAVTSGLFDRPRIALEGAFVAAVVVGVPFAASPEPIAVAPTYAVAGARGAMSDIEATVQVTARSAWATAQAFVAETSVAATSRLRNGTFDWSGASGQKGGVSVANDRDPKAAQENRR